MDHKPNKSSPAVSDSSNSRRMTKRRAHSFSSSLLEVICQSMDDHPSHRSQHIDDTYNKGVNFSKQNRTKTSAYAEIVVLQAGRQVIQDAQNAEKPIRRVQAAPSFSSSSIVSNFSCSDSSSTHGPLSSSVSSYGGPGSSSSCFSSCSSKSPTSSFKEKITKAKLKAIKLCTKLKKTKNNNPITPRCRLATYLNSLFTPKKQNKTERVVVVAQETYTKPKKINSITKPKPPPPSAFIKSENSTTTRHDQDAKGREIFKKCQEKIVRGLKMREFVEVADSDDAESYASSDLFELEFLMERGGEELPVFETTDIKINQAIANGFSL